MIDTEMTSMRFGQMQKLYIEIYKTLSDINPRYIQELFERSSSSYSTRRPNDLKVPKVNQTTSTKRCLYLSESDACFPKFNAA